MNVVWHAAPKYLIDSLEILQRKALRIVLRKDWYCHKKELYSEKILPVTTMCESSAAILIFKMSKNLAKNNHSFTVVNQLHDYPTRSNDRFYVEHCISQLSSQNFYVRAINIFNSLPANIRHQVSLSGFKNKCRQHLFNNCWN